METETATLDEALRLTERLPLTDLLRLISLLSERARHSLEQEGEPMDMLSLAGLGSEVWQEIDTDAYLAGERASWEN
jgi:hypothetical protein